MDSGNHPNHCTTPAGNPRSGGRLPATRALLFLGQGICSIRFSWEIPIEGTNACCGLIFGGLRLVGWSGLETWPQSSPSHACADPKTAPVDRYRTSRESNKKQLIRKPLKSPGRPRILWWPNSRQRNGSQQTESAVAGRVPHSPATNRERRPAQLEERGISLVARYTLHRVNYICRLASISFAGSPPWPGPVAGQRWSGSWGRQTPG